MDDTSTRLMRELSGDTIKLCENVHEVTCVAERLLKSGQITVKDSRDLFWESLEIARKFESQFDAGTGDYLADIEAYAENALRKAFPADACENENIYFHLRDGTVIQAQLCGDAADPEAGNGWASIDVIAILPGGYPETLCAVDYETHDPFQEKRTAGFACWSTTASRMNPYANRSCACRTSSATGRPGWRTNGTFDNKEAIP